MIIAIETSGTVLGLGLVDGNRKFWHVKEVPNRHSDLLIPQLRRLFDKAKLKPQDVSAVCVDTGPGSFTGIRIGVACARSLGQTLHVPVIGIPSLDIIAGTARHAPNAGQVICATVPALRNDVFAAIYRKTAMDIKRIAEYKLINCNDLSGWLDKSFGILSQDIFVARNKPDVRILAEIALALLQKIKNLTKFHYSKVLPFYLSPSLAEKRML